MALNDGQTIAVIVAASGSFTAVLGLIQNRFGKKIDRQTSLETTLLAQATECNKRIDALEREKAVSDAGFRAELEKGAAERRLIEREFRAEIDRLELEIKSLEARNRELEKENWLLKMGDIGALEMGGRRLSPNVDAPDEKKKES